MDIPQHLPQIKYGYDAGLTTITFSLIRSAIGCILLLFSFLKFKKQKY